jgi:hypothetical protein
MSNSKIQKLNNRCGVLSNIIAATRGIYLNATTQEKAFIETIIGAAIWYMPKPNNAWTGKISVGVLRLFHPESGEVRPRFSEEHVYPRKISARLLFEDENLSSNKLSELFQTKYGSLHYITQDENKIVQRFQRDGIFKEPEEAYLKAGIILIEVSDVELALIKKRDKKTIEKYL